MKIKLWPDKDIRVQKSRIGCVPTLILQPTNCSSVPVSVLWIHGGGFITGMKEMVYMSRAVDLVRKYGVTVYSPGYRLAWRRPYPAAVDDCYQVLEYMSRQGDALMVGGESAGGGLAAAVCMMARDKAILIRKAPKTITARSGIHAGITLAGGFICERMPGTSCRPTQPRQTRPITAICRHAIPSSEMANPSMLRR